MPSDGSMRPSDSGASLHKRWSRWQLGRWSHPRSYASLWDTTTMAAGPPRHVRVRWQAGTKIDESWHFLSTAHLCARPSLQRQQQRQKAACNATAERWLCARLLAPTSRTHRATLFCWAILLAPESLAPAAESAARLCGQRSAKHRHAPPASRHSTSRWPSSSTGLGRSGCRSCTNATAYHWRVQSYWAGAGSLQNTPIWVRQNLYLVCSSISGPTWGIC